MFVKIEKFKFVPEYFLNEVDLAMLTTHFVEMGMLFRRNPGEDDTTIRDRHWESLKTALQKFFMFAYKLKREDHHPSPDQPENTVVVSIDDKGTAGVWLEDGMSEMTVEQIKDAVNDIPPVDIYSLFPNISNLNRVPIGVDGFECPMFGAKLTFLRGGDGFFLAVSVSHVIADATSLWHFVNAWSQVARGKHIKRPFFERYFHLKRPPPLHLKHRFFEPVYNREPKLLPPAPAEALVEVYFHFPAASALYLKDWANKDIKDKKAREAKAAAKAKGKRKAKEPAYQNPPEEVEGKTKSEKKEKEEFSRFVSMVAFLWRHLVIAQGLADTAVTKFYIPASLRVTTYTGINQHFCGNCHCTVSVALSVTNMQDISFGELVEIIYRAIKEQKTVEEINYWFEHFDEQNELAFGRLARGCYVVANTHWADVYGNDYGSGGPLTVRSGRGKLEGYMTIHPGFEEKSLAIEVCLPRNDMLALLANEHFKKLLGMPMFPNVPNT